MDLDLYRAKLEAVHWIYQSISGITSHIHPGYQPASSSLLTVGRKSGGTCLFRLPSGLGGGFISSSGGAGRGILGPSCFLSAPKPGVDLFQIIVASSPSATVNTLFLIFITCTSALVDVPSGLSEPTPCLSALLSDPTLASSWHWKPFRSS